MNNMALMGGAAIMMNQAAQNNNDDEDVCPACGKPESIKVVCGHCGHEYAVDSDDGGVDVDLIVLAVIVWVLFTIIWWLMDQCINPRPTLLDILRTQWNFLRGLRIW